MKCLLVSASGTRMESALIVVYTRAAMMLRLWQSKLTAAARCELEADSRKVCVLVCVCSTQMGSACCRDYAPALIVVCNRAAMKLRLVEQACSCCTVRGGRGEGGLKRYACSYLPLPLGCRVFATATTHSS